MCNLYRDVLDNNLSDASQELLLSLLRDYLLHDKPITLPSRTGFIKRSRDDAIRLAYDQIQQLAPNITVTEFYDALMTCSRIPSGEADPTTLWLYAVHQLSNKFNLAIPSERQIRRIIGE